MAGLLTGLLASALGGGGQDNTSFGDRMAMNFAPQMYAAQQARQEQELTQNALSNMGGQPLPPGMAAALAHNPQMMQQAGGAYLPGPAKSLQIPGAFGQTSLLQERQQPGGNISATPITVGAPGTTSSAAQATTPAVAPGAAPAAQPGAIPGSTGALQDQIMAARKAGANRDQLISMVPAGGAELVKSVLDGTQTVKDLATRGVGENDRTSVIRLAHLIDPSWDENRSEALNTYRKGYMATGTQGTVGFQRQSGDTTLNHLDSVLDSATAMHNSDSLIGPAANLENRVRGWGGEQGALQDTFDAKTDMLAGETDKFISGKAATEGGTKQYKEKWSRNQTPRQTAAAASAYLDMVVGKKDALEKERNENFGSPEAASAYPIGGPVFDAKVAALRAKIAAMKAAGTAQAGTLRTPQEAVATVTPAAPTTNGGWTNFRVGK